MSQQSLRVFVIIVADSKTLPPDFLFLNFDCSMGHLYFQVPQSLLLQPGLLLDSSREFFIEICVSRSASLLGFYGYEQFAHEPPASALSRVSVPTHVFRLSSVCLPYFQHRRHLRSALWAGFSFSGWVFLLLRICSDFVPAAGRCRSWVVSGRARAEPVHECGVSSRPAAWASSG